MRAYFSRESGMRRDELGCDARRGDEAMLDASRGAATPQRAQFVRPYGLPPNAALALSRPLARGTPLPAARFARSSGFGCNAYHSPH